MARPSMLPMDVPVTSTWFDPDDLYRYWALGWSDTYGYVFLTRFCGDDGAWTLAFPATTDEGPDVDRVHWHFGITPARVRVWAEMLASVPKEPADD